MSLPVLSAAEQRVVGCLLEKQRTVPASYPLSLNSLRLACNQTSSRDPVVDYSEGQVQDVARDLKDRGLVRLVWAGAGTRTVKYHQLLDEVLPLADDERSLLTVLLLRGPQSPGELKTRTERLHAFPERSDVEACLERMAAAPEPLVRELPLTRGRDHRWIHLLGPVAGVDDAAPAAADLDSVLRDGPAARDALLVAAYDAASAAYSQRHVDDLTELPFDLWLLERVAEEAAGPIMDLGCGPGHLAAFLADTGAEVHGLDASGGMVDQARANYPDLDFTLGRFEHLLRPRDAAAWGAIVAWYAFVHLAPGELAATLATVATTLRPGGLLVAALHLGSAVRPVRDLDGVPVELDLVLHDRSQVLAAFSAAGLTVAEWYVRSPMASEDPTERLYVLARRPG